MKKITIILAVLIALFVVIYVSVKIPKGGKSATLNYNTVRIGLTSNVEISTLDPAKAISSEAIFIVLHLYDRLISVDSIGELKPAIFSSWEADNSFTKWKFVINPDLRVGDKKVPPDRIVGSIKRAIKIPSYGQVLLGTLIKGGKAFIDGKTKEIDGLFTKGDTIFIELNQSYKYLPYRFTTSFFCPVDTAFSEVDKPVVHLGPYILKEWNKTENKFILVKNPYYWRKLIYPDTLFIYWFKNPSSMIEEYFSGNLDFVFVPMDYVPVVQKRLNSREDSLIKTPSSNLRMVFINLKSKLGKYPNLRRALNLATQREQINQFLFGGKPLYGPVPNSIFKIERDTFMAWLGGTVNVVLKKSQYVKHPFKLKLLVENTSESRKIGKILVDQWKKAGINVEYQQGQADFVSKVLSGNFEMALSYYGSFYMHPEPYLWAYLAKYRPVPNVMSYKNPLVENLFKKFVSSNDELKSRETLRSMIKEIIKDSPCIWVIQDNAVYLVKKGIEYSIDPSGLVKFVKN